jgi:hypothetical protein
MLKDCHAYNSNFSSPIFQSHVIAAITSELEILKLKVKYIAQHPDFIDDPQQLQHHLTELMTHLNIINRGLPPLPSERSILDRDEREF